MNIQLLETESFVRFNKEVYIKSGDTIINQYAETFTMPDNVYYLTEDEIKDALNQSPNLLELALDSELVYIRNMESISFLAYVKSFN